MARVVRCIEASEILSMWAEDAAIRVYYEEFPNAWRDGTYWEFLQTEERQRRIAAARQDLADGYGLAEVA